MSEEEYRPEVPEEEVPEELEDETEEEIVYLEDEDEFDEVAEELIEEEENELIEMETVQEDDSEEEWDVPEIPDESIEESEPDTRVSTKMFSDDEPEESDVEFVDTVDDRLSDAKKKWKRRTSKFRKHMTKEQTRNLTLILIGASAFIFLVLGVSLHFLPEIDNTTGVFDYLPGNFVAEIMILWVITIIGFFILLPLFPLVAKLYLYIHKLVKFNRFQYSVVETNEEYVNFKEALDKFTIPYLFSFVLGYWFATWFFINSGMEVAISTLSYFLFAIILMPLVIFLTPPLWLLNDSGVISMKKRKDGERSLPDIEGPSLFFTNFYTGSAYTLALLTIIDFFREMFSGEFQVAIFFFAFLYIIFLLMPVTVLIVVYLYELFFRKAKDRLLKNLPRKLVDRMPKTVVDITALDPFYVPDDYEPYETNYEVDELKEPSDFDIETEVP